MIQRLGPKFLKKFRWFFGRNMTPKRHFEIIWPLGLLARQPKQPNISVWGRRESEEKKLPGEQPLEQHKKRSSAAIFHEQISRKKKNTTEKIVQKRRPLLQLPGPTTATTPALTRSSPQTPHLADHIPEELTIFCLTWAECNGL